MASLYSVIMILLCEICSGDKGRCASNETNEFKDFCFITLFQKKMLAYYGYLLAIEVSAGENILRIFFDENFKLFFLSSLYITELDSSSNFIE